MITPEEAPLAVFGTQASQSLVELLEFVGIHLHAGAYAEPAGRRARPASERRAHRGRPHRRAPPPRGPPVDGLPADANGFIPVDEYARVRGLDAVWAAGDDTDFPLKQGGIATQQADVAARAIAARAGVSVEVEPFRPLLRGILLTGTGAWWLRSAPGGGDGEGELGPGTRSGGRRARSPDAGSPRTWPSATRAPRTSLRPAPRSRSAWRTPALRKARTPRRLRVVDVLALEEPIRPGGAP